MEYRSIVKLVLLSIISYVCASVFSEVLVDGDHWCFQSSKSATKECTALLMASVMPETSRGFLAPLEGDVANWL